MINLGWFHGFKQSVPALPTWIHVGLKIEISLFRTGKPLVQITQTQRDYFRLSSDLILTLNAQYIQIYLKEPIFAKSTPNTTYVRELQKPRWIFCSTFICD